MREEIKEILDKLKDDEWYEELDLTGDKWIELKQTETNKILDYITNLQQENEDLKNRLENAVADCILRLQENERLNNIINMAISAINTYQDSKTLSIGYENLKRIRGILRGNDFDIQMFEEYLKELKESVK